MTYSRSILLVTIFNGFIFFFFLFVNGNNSKNNWKNSKQYSNLNEWFKSIITNYSDNIYIYSNNWSILNILIIKFKYFQKSNLWVNL